MLERKQLSDIPLSELRTGTTDTNRGIPITDSLMFDPENRFLYQCGLERHWPA